jgi:PAS domain S-box-containing protein
MVVPFLDGKRIVTIAGVGNKASDYEKSDERQVALLLSGMWNCVQKSRSMERLEKAYSELEDRVKERTGELAASTAALLESQKDLNRAQAVAHTGSWRLDVQRNELMWSDEAYKIFGIPKGTLLTYETFLDCVHPEDRKYVNQKWREAMRGKMYDIEHRIAADGQIKWVRERAELEFEKDGTLLGGFGTVTDITRRKEMEEALREAKEGLEIKVAERTAELAEAISSLQREMQERVKAEENVEAERKRLYDVLETLPAYVCLLTTDYRMPFANRVFRETFGYSPSEKCYEFLFNRTEPCEKCETYSILKTNKPHRWKWAGPNGRDYDVFDFPFKDTNRSQLILEMGIDITELKRSEIRTNVTNTLLGLFVQKTTKREYLDSVVRTIRDWSGCQCIGIRLTDSEGRIPYESHTGFSEEFIALENMLSLKKDSCTCVRVISQKPEPLSSPVTTSRGSFHCNNSLNFINSLPEKSRARYRGNCMRFGFASLAVVPIRYRDKVLGAIHLADKEEGKMPLDAVEFLEDIAALIGEAVHRFNVEESLRLNERRLSEAQELAHLGNWELDMTGNKLWWSDEGYRIFGLEPKHSETTYEHFLSYVHSDDRKLVEESVSKALNEGKEFDIDHRIIRTDGSERVVNVKAEVVYDSNHKPVKVVGTLHDITEQIKAENEILENQRSLRALAAELQIVEEQERRRIAQDLHDSIGQILSFSGRELKNLQKSVSEKAAKTLQEVANQLDNAVEQTRTLSFDLSPSTLYDLGLEVAIEDLLDRISQKRNIKCHFKSCESAKPLADDVKVLLYRSARELLINAVKHANASFLKVSLSRSRSDICIKVEDDGRGFDTSILESGSKKAKGFGIFSIRERLNHIGGHMRIESAEGKGTRAILTAPLDIEEE